MKKAVLFLLIMVMGLFVLKAQNQNIPLSEITEIANRNANALWGNVYPDEPIPYYSAQDEIIAYMFNYSIEKPFPGETGIID